MSAIVIHPRSAWTKTKPGGSDQTAILHRYTLFIHYSDGPAPKTIREAEALIENIREFHTGPERGWDDIGYNYLCAWVGGKLHVWGGRGQHKIPAAQQGCNSGNLAICFLGDSTTAIPAGVVDGLAEFARRYRAGRVKGHTECTAVGGNTDCPGPRLLGKMDSIAKKAGVGR